MEMQSAVAVQSPTIDMQFHILGFVLETVDPWEFVTLFRELPVNPARDRALRRAGQ